MDKSDLLEFADGKRSSVSYVLYDHDDGLKTAGISKVSSGTSAKGADGRIWFAIDGHLSVVDPKALYASKVPPWIHFEGVFVNRKEVPLKETIEIDSTARVIDVHFMAISYGAATNSSNPAYEQKETLTFRRRTKLDKEEATYEFGLPFFFLAVSIVLVAAFLFRNRILGRLKGS